MKRYRLLMHGRNFLIESDGKTDSYAFYQNIFLEADTLKQAKLLATSKIWHDKKLMARTLNSKEDPPRINLATYWEMDAFDYVGKHLSTDRTLYKENKWWEFWKKD
jgi:hypothetical protein